MNFLRRETASHSDDAGLHEDAFQQASTRSSHSAELPLNASGNSFNRLLLRHWDSLTAKLRSQADRVLVDGQTLDLAAVVAVARYGKLAVIDEATLPGIVSSAEAVQGRLSAGEVLYGINTGFGGSADTRNSEVIRVQRSLIRDLNYGILSDEHTKRRSSLSATAGIGKLLAQALPLDDAIASTSMPESWVRASMLIRLSSLVKGASGVRPSVLETLLNLVNHDIVPRIPLRGSISASGDLSPLSYIAGAMMGKPSMQVYAGARDAQPRQITRADRALKSVRIEPIDVRAKEGLAIVNGTAVSAGVASLALHEALMQAMLAQVLTAMAVEALAGTSESFDPFIAEVRPHPGQVESARNISSFLRGSKLVFHNDGSQEGSLSQDRYSIRTASQWVGPVLEDLMLAYDQISIEMNSVTDNPIVNPDGKLLHGGNFQAKSVTCAMEKVRQACQTIGRMHFTQCTEMINPATSRGLSPNLVVDEPSDSWIWKGTDIMVAALLSELGYLANPVGTHVQTAEMGNQALNSLALISSRYTLQAIEVLSQLSAAHLVALCQAIDLRALHRRFVQTLAPVFTKMTEQIFSGVMLPGQSAGQLATAMWQTFQERIQKTTTVNSDVRFSSALESMQGLAMLSLQTNSSETLNRLSKWQKDCSETASRIYQKVKSEYMAQPDASSVVGPAARKLYTHVRQDVGVPFSCDAMLSKYEMDETDETFDAGHRGYRSSGAMITAVYESMRSGQLYDVVMSCLRDASSARETTGKPKL